MIGSALAGLLLSTTLAACGGNAGRATAAPEPVVVVRELPPQEPPAELLACPVAPQGLPETGGAVIPADWRAAIVRLARSRGAMADQLGRLIQWHTGRAC